MPVGVEFASRQAIALVQNFLADRGEFRLCFLRAFGPKDWWLAFSLVPENHRQQSIDQTIAIAVGSHEDIRDQPDVRSPIICINCMAV